MIPGSPATADLRHLLADLAGSGCTGALHVGGTPGGTLYLVAGRIAYAESPACPDIRERLLRSGRLTPAGWDAAYRAGTAEQAVGRLLVRDGGLEQGELVCHVLAIICDAGHAVLQTLGAALRFVPDERHWLGLITQLQLTALGREMVRRSSPGPSSPERADPRPVDLSAAAGAARAETAPAGTTRSGMTPVETTPGAAGPIRRAAPNALPRRTGPSADGRAPNTGPQADDARHAAPDYATLKRIRQALKSAG